jgi:hypothetical protein
MCAGAAQMLPKFYAPFRICTIFERVSAERVSDSLGISGFLHLARALRCFAAVTGKIPQ